MTRDETLLAAHRAAASFYRDELLADTGASPRDYLCRRGFSTLIGDEGWVIGYAPPGWTPLTNHLHAMGFTSQDLLTAGLALRTRRGGTIDRFRDRLMFGLHHPDGDLVGFTGRAAPAAAADCPKYLNTPTTPIYDKSHLLFGVAEQHQALLAGAVPVIVEGPLDALAVHLTSDAYAGISPCGTALADPQAKTLAQRTRAGHVIVVFDGDAPGHHAAIRALPLLTRCFPTVDAAELPDGSDPADLMQTDRAALRGLLDRARPLSDVVIDTMLCGTSGRLDSVEARLSALRQLAPLVLATSHQNIADRVARLASGLDLDHDTVTRELTEATQIVGASPARPLASDHDPSTTLGTPRRDPAAVPGRSVPHRLRLAGPGPTPGP